MMKRVLLFLATNLLVVLTISILLQVLGISGRLHAYGMDYQALFLFCLIWGMAGAFISLAISRIMAKMFMGVKVIDPRQPGQFAGLVEMVHGLRARRGCPPCRKSGFTKAPRSTPSPPVQPKVAPW